jgi:hypothetical protein
MTRRFTAAITLSLLAGLLVFDQATTPANPWQAPAAFALGSGMSTSGGFCGALPN